MLDQATLKTHIHYDPETGVFTRLTCTLKHLIGPITNKPKKDGYVYAFVEGKEYLLHRLAWLYMTGAWPKGMIDHKSRDRSDNRWHNLREATGIQQSGNLTPNLLKRSKSGIRGVRLESSGKWMAYMKIADKSKRLGTFESMEEARTCYEKHARERWGEFYTPWDAPLPASMPIGGYPQSGR